MIAQLFQNPNVMVGRVDGTSVLFNLEDRQLHSLNETAAKCWDLLEGAPTLDLLVTLVSQFYGIDADEVSAEVGSVVSDFRAAGLCGSNDDFRDLSSSRSHLPITVSRHLKDTSIGPFIALGVPVVLDVDDPDLRHDLANIVAPLPRASEDAALIDIAIQRDTAMQGETGGWSFSVNGGLPLRFSNRQATIRHVVASLNSKPLDIRDDVVVFHASAAEFDGGVSLFPGVSNAGKSTLITQLVHRGHKYVSDEAVAVTPGDLQALPFPKSISIDVGSQEYLSPMTQVPPRDRTIDVDPRQIGPGRISNGGVVNNIIFPEYRTCSPTVLEPLDPFDAFSRLLSNSFRFDTAGQAAFDVVVSLANNVSAFALTHSGDVAHLELIERLSSVRKPVSVSA